MAPFGHLPPISIIQLSTEQPGCSLLCSIELHGHWSYHIIHCPDAIFNRQNLNPGVFYFCQHLYVLTTNTHRTIYFKVKSKIIYFVRTGNRSLYLDKKHKSIESTERHRTANIAINSLDLSHQQIVVYESSAMCHVDFSN